MQFPPQVVGTQLLRLCGHYGMFLGVQLRNFAQICAARVLCLPVIFLWKQGKGGWGESDNNLVQDSEQDCTTSYSQSLMIL